MARNKTLTKENGVNVGYNKAFVMDTETTTTKWDEEGEPAEVGVFAWIGQRIEDSTTWRGTDGASMMRFIYKLAQQNANVYFHNLKYDWSFIEDILLLFDSRDWAEIPLSAFFNYNDDDAVFGVKGKSCAAPTLTYATIRDSMATYEIVLTFDGIHWLTVKDSAKLYPTTVDALGSVVGVKKMTENFDYDKKRTVGDDLTAKEWEYVEHDADIVSRMLSSEFKIDDLNIGAVPLTRSSNAYNNYLKPLVKKYNSDPNFKWGVTFPATTIELYEMIGPSYAGGRTFVNPRYAGLNLHCLASLDANSMHPSQMLKDMPVGEVHIFEGTPSAEDSESYPFHVYEVSFDSFKMKPDGFATLMPKWGKNSDDIFNSEQVKTDAWGDPANITMTSLDLKWFKKNYDIVNLEIVKTYAWANGGKIFKDAVIEMYEAKNKAKHDMVKYQKMYDNGNRHAKEKLMAATVQKMLSKLNLNGTYGKLGQSPVNHTKRAVKEYDEENDTMRVAYELGIEVEDSVCSYLPAAIFITAYSRDTLYTMIEAVGVDNWVYSDTDSCKVFVEALKKPEVKKLMDEFKLGYWKVEEYFDNGKFLRPKSYVTSNGPIGNETDVEVTAAGLNGGAFDDIKSVNDFTFKAYDNNTMSKRLRGGTLIYKGTKVISKRANVWASEYQIKINKSKMSKAKTH